MAKRRGRHRGRPLFVISARKVFLYAVLLICILAAFAVSRKAIFVGADGPLSGQVILIDPGHGGIDPGACGRKYYEKDIVLRVALYLGVKLQKSGAKVVYTRTGDYDLESATVDDLTARVRLIDSSKATIVISIHCNAFTSPDERGAQTFYNASRHPDSKKLAQLIQSELIKETQTEREASAKVDHFMLNHAKVPAVTVELGFLSNPDEEKLLASSNYQQKLANCIYKAVISFVNPQL